MDITLSIVNWNTRDEIERCLKSALAQTGVVLEVIVVDNASSDGSAKHIAEHFPSVTLIANDKNVGFGSAHNQSIRASHGRYVMLLNPDAYLPETDILAKLVAFADANEEAGIIGPKILNPDGSLQLSARRFPTLGAGVFRRTPLGKLFPNNRFVKQYVMSDWSHDEVRYVDWVSGSAMMFRREAVESIGLFDQGFFMYCEDVDWCYSAKERGWQVCYYPMATVVHQIGAASDKAPIRMIYHFHRSMFRFYLKHYAKGPMALLAPVVFAGLAARAVFFMVLSRIPLSREAHDGGERLVR